MTHPPAIPAPSTAPVRDGADPHTITGGNVRTALAALGIGGPAEDIARVDISPEQAVRADAASTAAQLLGDCSGTPAGIAARLIELAEPIAAWIADGTHPAGSEPVCTCYGITNRPGCPAHGKRSRP